MLPNTTHPGKFLKDILSDRGLTQSHLARHIDVRAEVINLICKGKRGISAVMAKKLARALGTDSELWINLQSSYDLTTAEDQISENFGLNLVRRSSAKRVIIVDGCNRTRYPLFENGTTPHSLHRVSRRCAAIVQRVPQNHTIPIELTPTPSL